MQRKSYYENVLKVQRENVSKKNTITISIKFS